MQQDANSRNALQQTPDKIELAPVYHATFEIKICDVSCDFLHDLVAKIQ